MHIRIYTTNDKRSVLEEADGLAAMKQEARAHGRGRQKYWMLPEDYIRLGAIVEIKDASYIMLQIAEALQISFDALYCDFLPMRWVETLAASYEQAEWEQIEQARRKSVPSGKDPLEFGLVQSSRYNAEMDVCTIELCFPIKIEFKGTRRIRSLLDQKAITTFDYLFVSAVKEWLSVVFRDYPELQEDVEWAGYEPGKQSPLELKGFELV